METSKSCLDFEEGEAKLYHKRSADLQTPDGIEFINCLSVAEGSKVLDLGCGTGNLTVELAKRVGSRGQVVGVDPDGERIKVAKKENSLSANTSFNRACGETFPEDQYDLVFSNYVLHWIENKDAVFKRVYNNLRPGGVFAFTITLKEPALVEEVIKALNESVQREIRGKRFYASVDKLEALAITSGFTVDYKDTGVSSHLYTNIDKAMEFLFASSNGDTTLVNQRAVEELKRKYGQQEVEFSEEFATMILTRN